MPNGLPNDPARICVAHRSDGQPCERMAILGSTVCAKHGGSTDHIKRKAAERVMLDKARQLVALLDADASSLEDPVSALMNIAAQCVALVDLLRSHVADLQMAIDQGEATLTDEDHGGVRAEIAAYNTALANAEKTLSHIIRLGLETKLVRIEEFKAELMARVIETVLRQNAVDVESPVVRRQVFDALKEAKAG